MTKKLIWKLHPGGMCNQLMSVEIALGISKWLNRKLVVVDDSTERNIGTFSNEKTKTNLLSLFDFPQKIEWVRTGELDIEGSKSNYSHAIGGSVACVDNEFKKVDESFHPNGNQVKYFRDNFSDNIIVGFKTNDSLSYYNRFFYGDTADIFKHIRKIKVKSPYAKLARKISKDIGSFNSIHMRLGDWTNFLYGGAVSDEARIDRLLDAINSSLNIPSNRMVISSNLRSDETIVFNRLRENFPDILILENFIEMNYSDELNKLPVYDKVVLGLLSALVCSEAENFWGCIGSTFTNFINRYRKDKPKYHDIMFFNIGNDPMQYDWDGSIKETEDGKYPWNRSKMQALGTWFFEYKEI